MRPYKSPKPIRRKTHYQKNSYANNKIQPKKDNIARSIFHFHIMVMGSHGLDCPVRNQRAYRDHRPRNRWGCCLWIFSLRGGISCTCTCAICWCRRCTGTIESTLALLNGALIRRILRLLLLELFVGRSLRDHVRKELEIVGVWYRRSYCTLACCLTSCQP